MSAEKNRVLFLYGLNQGVHWFSVGIIIPVITLLMLERGFTLSVIGTAMSLMSFTVLFLELPTGGISDSIGRKKVYLASVFFSIAAYSIMFFARRPASLAAVTVFMGIARALSSGTMDAWFIDEYKRAGADDEGLQAALAKAGIIIPAALGLGTLVGGIIPDLLLRWGLDGTSAGLYGGNPAVAVLLYVVQLFLTGIFIKEKSGHFDGRILDGFRRFPEVISSAVRYGITKRNTLMILLATAALGIGLSGLEGLWQPRFRELAPDTGIWVLGVISALYFLAAAAGSALSPWLLRKTGYRYGLLLFLFRLFAGVFYLLLSFTLTGPAFAPVYLLIFLAHGVTGSPEMTLFNRDVPDGRRSTLLSLNSLFLQGGGGAGALLSGFMAENFGIPAAWRITGSVFLLSAVFFLMIKEESRENKV